MSYASMSADVIMNILKPGKVLMFQEGLNIFRAPVHASLVGKSLIESHLRRKTGFTVIAISSKGVLTINPDPAIPLCSDDEMVLIGTTEAEKLFNEEY